MTEAGIDNTEAKWKLKKELKPVSTDLNTVNALMVTLDRQGRIVSFNKACEQTTGYSFNEVRGRYVWELFLIPEEVERFKTVCEKLKAGSSPEYKYESYWVMKDGSRRRIAWSNSVLLSNEDTVEYIIGTGIDITEREPWVQELIQHNQRTQLLSLVTLKIRQSLQLEEILQTTVTQVRNLLQADRVLIYRLWSDGTGSGVTEAVVPGWSTVLGQTFEPEVFPEESRKLYASGRVRAIEDVEKADISPCLVEFLQQFEVKAKLVVPILLKEELWGLLVAHQCVRPRHWSNFEIELLNQLADQVSIALAQAQHQEHLEELVAERTAKLTYTLEQLQQEITERKRAEKALRQSEERWRFLVKNAPDIIFTCDRSGKLLYINRTVPGFTVEQVLGTSIYDYIPPEHQDTWRQSFERVFQTGESVYYETTGLGPNGTNSWYASRVGAVQHDGQVVAMMVIATDITERKKAEELLHRREQEFRALVENSPDSIVRFDPQLRHVYVNPSVERLTGIPKQTFIGKTNQDLGMPQELVACWQEAMLDVLTTGLERIVEFDFPTPSGIKWFQSRIVPELTRDGTIGSLLGVTRDITERKQAEEELRQSEAKFRELAQREALLNQLANQIRRSLDLNTILETAVHEIRNVLQIDRCFFLWYRANVADAVWEVVTEARSAAFPSLINYCVPVTTFGPLTARVFNKEITRVDNARSLTDPAERKFFFSIGYTALLALPIHTTSGEIGVVSCGHSSGPRPWRDSEVELLQAVADQIAIAIDQAELYKQSHTAAKAAQEQATKLEQALAELQQTQAQLVQSEKMSSLGQLVAGVAHEINNPVNFIYANLTYVNQYAEGLLSLVQLYQKYHPQPEAEIQAETEAIDLDFLREDLPKILSSMKMGADRIFQIVLSLRNFSRVDEAEMKWANIHEGLDNTLLILAHRLRSKNPEAPRIQIIKDYGNLPKVQCYPGQLNQVFMNILTNAIDAIEDDNKNCSPEDIKNHRGIIWICTEVLADGNQVIILIGDNGPGMTQEVRKRIFDPFFTTKPVGSGTGLGMSISYQIVVEKHGGQLQCISAPGQGTAFLISVPIQQPSEG
jgi:PAS domain S-box-containing protein